MAPKCFFQIFWCSCSLERIVRKKFCKILSKFQFKNLSLTHDFDVRLEPLLHACMVQLKDNLMHAGRW